MDRNFNNIEISPEEVMSYAVQSGHITLHRYMLWLISERTEEGMEEAFIGSMEDRAKLQ